MRRVYIRPRLTFTVIGLIAVVVVADIALMLFALDASWLGRAVAIGVVFGIGGGLLLFAWMRSHVWVGPDGLRSGSLRAPLTAWSEVADLYVDRLVVYVITTNRQRRYLFHVPTNGIWDSRRNLERPLERVLGVIEDERRQYAANPP